MHGMLEYGLISDDHLFASVMSSYFQEDKKYFPIFSLPRMFRNDWEIEVVKRGVSIKRSEIELLFCKDSDYELLAPLRSFLGMDLILLKEPKDVVSIIDIDLPKETININENDYLVGLLQAKVEHKILNISKEAEKFDFSKSNQSKSDTLVVIEKTNRITDVAALNYAIAKGYDILIIDAVPEELEESINNLFISLTSQNELKKVNFKNIYKQIDMNISKLVDRQEIENKYKRVQFVTSEVPLGILIESIPVAHIFHLQSELRFVDEYHYLQKKQYMEEQLVPSFLFVDIGAEDLISEIPEISNLLKEKKIWQFNLNGKNANRQNFSLYARYFPYDLALISGHGKSPDCREVVYSFKDLKGKIHTMKLLQYYQFGPVKGDKVHVETKEYFLEFDGIDWNNKEKLSQIGISHLMREWLNAHHQHKTKLVEYKNVNPKSIEGIALSDGVFIGFIHVFSVCNNPILILNTCASLIELGKTISFAGPRSLIGTMWSIYDRDARIFANRFFESISSYSIAESFHKARSVLQNQYSKLAYVHFGTLDSHLSLPTDVKDEKRAAENMAKRLMRSLSEAVDFAYRGWISLEDLKPLIKLDKLSEKFIANKLPQEIELRRSLDKIKTRLDLK